MLIDNRRGQHTHTHLPVGTSWALLRYSCGSSGVLVECDFAIVNHPASSCITCQEEKHNTRTEVPIVCVAHFGSPLDSTELSIYVDQSIRDLPQSNPLDSFRCWSVLIDNRRGQHTHTHLPVGTSWALLRYSCGSSGVLVECDFAIVNHPASSCITCQEEKHNTRTEVPIVCVAHFGSPLDSTELSIYQVKDTVDQSIRDLPQSNPLNSFRLLHFDVYHLNLQWMPWLPTQQVSFSSRQSIYRTGWSSAEVTTGSFW